MTTLQEKIAVMQAAAEGKAIQQCYRGSTPPPHWYDTMFYDWDWVVYEYRVRPETTRIRIAKWFINPKHKMYAVHVEDGLAAITTEEFENREYFRGWVTDWIEVEK